MASIRLLLDTFGPPPREICLDWAHQIKAAKLLDRGPPTGAEPRDATAEDDEREAHWTGIEVASDGQLRLEGLSAATARQALDELCDWLARQPAAGVARDNARRTAAGSSAVEAMSPEVETSAVGSGACSTLAQPTADHQRRPVHATGKRAADGRARWLTDRRLRWAIAGTTLIALGVVSPTLWLPRDRPQPGELSQGTTSTGGSQNASEMNSFRAVRSVDSAADADFLAASNDGAIAAGWTTSAELTAGFGEASSLQAVTSTASASPAALSLAPPPSLLASSVEADVTAGDAASAAVEPSASLAASDHSDAPAPNAKDFLSAPMGDVMNQVTSALEQAEQQGDGDQPTEDGAHMPLHSAEAEAAGSQDEADRSVDWTHQPPIMLTRDTNRLHPPTPRGLLSRALREPRCTARLELSDEFVCEPASVQTILVASKDPRSKDLHAKIPSRGEWRIYDQDAKSPRACIIVSVRPRSGREFGLDWSLRGGAEDLPELRLPLSRNWLDALMVQLKVTAASLQAFIDAPSINVPRDMRSLVQQQRQYARQQLKTAERLLTLLADVDRLAGFIDGELLAHAEVREGEGGRLLLAYGSCESEPAAADDASPRAD